MILSIDNMKYSYLKCIIHKKNVAKNGCYMDKKKHLYHKKCKFIRPNKIHINDSK